MTTAFDKVLHAERVTRLGVGDTTRPAASSTVSMASAPT